MEQQKPATSISIGGESYRSGMLYWGVIAVVVVIFLVTTLNYWFGTLKILDESSNGAVDVRRAQQAIQPGL